MDLPTFKEIEELQCPVDSIPLVEGQIIFCSDTGNMYKDTRARTKLSKDIIILNNLTALNNILDPLPEKLYIVLEDGSIYTRNVNSWLKLGKDYFRLDDIVMPASPYVINNDRIRINTIGNVIPNLSVIDLVSDISIVCADRTATVTYTASHPIIASIEFS